MSVEISNKKRLDMIASCAESIMRWADAVSSGNVDHSVGNIYLNAEIIRDNAKRLLEKTKGDE